MSDNPNAPLLRRSALSSTSATRRVAGTPVANAPLLRRSALSSTSTTRRVAGTRVANAPLLSSISTSQRERLSENHIQISNQTEVKTTPAGKYLINTLDTFDLEDGGSVDAISARGNDLLILVLNSIVKAGPSKEHELLAEIRNAVFTCIQKLEKRGAADVTLIAKARILYLRSLLARSSELQSIKVFPVDSFLEKANFKWCASSNCLGRSSVRHAEERMQVTRWEHPSRVNLREISEEAKSFSTGNKSLAALFVHTPAGQLRQQIISWLVENFEFQRGTSGAELEYFLTAIMDGWMAGLSAAMPTKRDAFSQLLSEYTNRLYTSQLQHLKEIAETLVREEAKDLAHVAKLHSDLTSVVSNIIKTSIQRRRDLELFTLGYDGSSIQDPYLAAADARLASLISLDGILKQVEDIMRRSSVNILSRSKKSEMLESLDKIAVWASFLLKIDRLFAEKQISDARHAIESIPEDDEREQSHASRPADAGLAQDTDVAFWNVMQFSTQSKTPFIIKCGVNSDSELVIEGDSSIQDPKGGLIRRVIPRPSVLANMSLEEIKQLFSQLPEGLSLLTLAPTADETRGQYSKLYRAFP